MSINNSRRDFMKKSSLMVGTAAVLGAGVLTGCSSEPQVIEKEMEVPAYPYPSCEFDLDKVEKLGYEGYYENGCCYGVAKALMTELSEKVGAPFTFLSPEIFANGKEGYGVGSLCGAMGGAVGVIGMLLPAKEAREVTKQLTDWYTSTNLPIYQPEIKAEASTISASVNCADSVTRFMAAAGITDMKDDRRRARCGGVTADVAKKTAELLNVHFGFMAPVVEEKEEVILADNEFIGEGEGFGGKVKVKVTMDGDRITKIDVLSHSETAGISDAAFNTIPDAIIAAQSADIDVASGATMSSNAIMAAVKDALAKAGK